MKWITNAGKEEVTSMISDLCRGWNGRVLVTGRPKASDVYSREEMEGMGIVGVYETAPGTTR